MAKISKSLQNIAAVAAIVGACATVGTWLFPSAGGLSLRDLHQSFPNIFTPTLVISATGAEVEIRTSSRKDKYDGGKITATGSNHIVYISNDQTLRVKVTGTGVNLKIATRTLERVEIDDSGTGTTLYEI